MKELVTKIEEFTKRKKQRRILAGASTLLAIAVIAIVSMSLSKPAISEESDTADFSDFSITTAVDISDKIQSPTVSDNTTTSNDGETVTAKVTFEYTLNGDEITLTSDNKYVYLVLDDSIQALSTAKSGIVTDEAYSKYLRDIDSYTDENAAIGDYVIDDSNTIIIKFRDKYLTWLEGSGVQAGTFELEADFTRGEDKGSTQYDYNIGNATVTIGGYVAKSLGVDKSGKDNGDGTATWTITINNADGSFDTNYWLIDEMLDNLSEGTQITVTDANGNTGTISAITGTDNKKDVLFANDIINVSGGTASNSYTITYTTPFSYDKAEYDSSKGGYYVSASNEVTLTDGTNTHKSTATVDHTSTVSTTKTYVNNYDESTITWTITLDNPDGLDLDEAYLTDSAFADIEAKNISISPSVAFELTTLEDEDGNITGGKVTLNGTCTDKKVTITYTVPAKEDEEGTNTVYVYNKDGGKISYAYHWYRYDSVSVSKGGTANKESETITWTVEVTTNKSTLNGFTFSDTMSDYAESFEITAYEGIYGGSTVTASLEANDDGSYILKTEGNAKKAVITYTTPFYVDEDTTNGGEANDDGTEITYHNYAEFGFGEDSDGDDEKVTVKPTNNVSKTAGTAKTSEDYTTFTVPWTITLDQEMGSYPGKELKDTVTIPEGFTLNSILDLELVSSDGNVTLTADDYTYSVDTATGVITVSFNNTDATKSLTKLIITYTTKFTVDLDTTSAGENITVTNTVIYNNKTSVKTVNYYRPDLDSTPVSKTVDGKDELTLTPEELASYKKIHTENGAEVDYYEFEYTITIDISDSKKLVEDDNGCYVYTDELPEGFKLCTDEAIVPYWNSNGALISFDIKLSTSSTDNNGYYEYANDKLTFYLKSAGIAALTYSAKVPCTIVDKAIEENGGYTAVNTVSHSNYTKATQVITVEKETVTDEGIINKEGEQNGNGSIRYQIDVNTDGKTLVGDGETLTLTDTLVCDEIETGDSKNSTTTAEGDNTEFTPSIAFIQIYKINEDGTTGDKLDGWSYSINTDLAKTIAPDGVTAATTISMSTIDLWSTSYDAYEIPDAKADTDCTVTLYAADGVDDGTTITYGYQTNTGWGNNVFASTTSNQTATFEDGKITVTIHTGNAAGLKIFFMPSWYNYYPSESVGLISVSDGETTWGSSYSETSALAKLTITGLPDATPLRIVYTYDTNSDSQYANVKLTNSAELNGTGYSDFDTDWYIAADKSGATATGAQYLSLEKIDVGNGTLTLSAGFELYKYVGGKWLPAVAVTKPLSSDGTENTSAKYWNVTWGDNENDVPHLLEKEAGSDTINLVLESGILYRIDETKEPDEYTSLDEYFGGDEGYTTSFYFSYVNEAGDVPDYVTDYKVITSSGKFAVKNVRKINITVSKNWIGLAEGLSSQVKAEFQLIRSTDATFSDESSIEAVDLKEYYKNLYGVLGEPIPDDIASVINDSGNLVLTGSSASEILQSLPNGEDDNGNAYYYKVKEVRYSLDGGETWIDVDDNSTYQPVYTGNSGTNTDSTITVTNVTRLTIKKVWRDSDGVILTNTDDCPGVKIEIYRVEAGKELTDEEIYTKDNLVETCELNSANGYSVSYDESVFEGYADGTKYKYYAKEILENDEWTVAYYYDTTSNDTEVITVTNKYKPKEVSIVLPSTGSTGTKKLMFAGLVLIGVGLLAVGLKLRRRQYDR